MPMPFGLKMPSRGTLIFSGVAGALSGSIYTSNKKAAESRSALAQRVQYLADRPCGVHEMPRKVLVYISAPPGDGLEKSRNWFREYIKPVLVAGAVDYEVKEASQPGQIETSVIEEVVKQRREDTAPKLINETDMPKPTNPFISSGGSKEIKMQESSISGILAVGRNAYREVLSGLSKGCEASLIEKKEEEKEGNKEEKTEEKVDIDGETNPQTKEDLFEPTDDPIVVEPLTEDISIEEEAVPAVFSLPSKFSPVVYIPHTNIIGWSNIPYRIYMWFADYKRIEDVGEYVVAAVMNQTRPVESKDADKGQGEKAYWIGDEKVEKLKEEDKPIEIDERILDRLSTYTSDTLP
ncbi:mitochondrial import inner membrane translocase subunit Tim54 [Sporodiniella umbellata]|nr:mitochondrial import inner membrane translocase subunit Tim54 [Sporodiniella umbellata]